VIGEGDVAIKGLEQAVVGMHQGETKTVIIPPDQAFGPRLNEKIHVINRSRFPSNVQPAVGLKFEIRQEDGVVNVITVTDVSESEVTLDANHPLSGKGLRFEIELLTNVTAQSRLAEEYYKTAVDLQEKGLIDDAISYYQKTIDHNPNFAGAYYNLGVACQQKGQLDQAIVYYEIAIGLNQKFTEAHHNLGVAFKDKGLFDEAIMCFQRAIQLHPDHADAYYNLGNTLVAMGKFEEAMQSYRKTIEFSPDHADAHWSIALLQLRSGNFEDGWKGYEWRWKMKNVIDVRNFPQPLWDGSDIPGKTILLHSEQGFGDTIQFIRYAPMVSDLGAKVIVECQKELVSLLKNVEGIHSVIPRDDQLPDFDFNSPLLSLPFIFGTKLETIPAKIPYISANPATVQKWQDRIESVTSAARIGLVWAGNPKLKFGHSRSCPFEAFSSLAELDDIIFYSLQKGEPSGHATDSPKGMKLVDYTEDIHDFSDTAAIISNMDLIISVDTAVAHLAGALGKPVWILLPFVPDWRWMKDREDSPWYPTMRLFRQPSSGDWRSVMKHVEEALKNFVHL
jgi:FKBP-type peptidyl-prolyl cis-trans isomerase 2